MLFFHNISSVAKYESKLLIRSWFFKVFTVITLAGVFFINFNKLKGGEGWAFFAIDANVPYLNMQMINIIQSIIVIFLASDFLKRDKKLDTSEVFYVRPLSNAEYLLGKVWGTLRVFFVFDLIMMALVIVFNYLMPAAHIDSLAYAEYFFLTSIPSLIYIMGLSIFLMMLFNSQALTFIILLGYIGIQLFYVDNKLFYVFDYATNSFPMMKSNIVGYYNLSAIVIQRLIYLFLGLGFILASIYQFRRLPNSSRSVLPWVVLSVVMFSAAGFFIYKHLNNYYNVVDNKALYIEINNKYIDIAKLKIESYDIELTQGKNHISATARMKGVPERTSNEFVFTLNPSLTITSIEGAEYKRDHQIVVVYFGDEKTPSDTLDFALTYTGTIDENFCYLDIDEEVMFEKRIVEDMKYGKNYSFMTDKYLLLTPETYWYPRVGTGYSDTRMDWQQSYFSNYRLRVKPLKGLVAISSGEATESDGIYNFAPEYPMPSATLTIGEYEYLGVDVDSLKVGVWYFKGHDYFRNSFDSIHDTIPATLRSAIERIEFDTRFDYPFKTLSIVETPLQFMFYPRMWTVAQENQAPELILFPEKGFSQWMNFDARKKNQKENSERRGQSTTDLEVQYRVFNQFTWIFRETTRGGSLSMNNGKLETTAAQTNPYHIFPQLYNFRYNIYSPQWAVANRLIELYMQNRSASGQSWVRQYSGLSDEEKVNLLIEKKSFITLLTDPEARDLRDVLVSTAGNRLFAESEFNIGIDKFRDTLYTIIKSAEFDNINFEGLIDTLSGIGKSDIAKGFSEWNTPMKLPRYVISEPTIRFINDKEGEIYEVETSVGNLSDVPGFLRINVSGIRSEGGTTSNGEKTRWMVKMEPNQSKNIVAHWADSPRRFTINTMMSGNLPSSFNIELTNVIRDRRRGRKPDGEQIINNDFLKIPGEIIVDNEDSLRFSLSEPLKSGYLSRWIGDDSDTSFRYSGVVEWWPPFTWKAVTDSRCYGQTIRSSYMIRGDKKGSDQWANWSVPVPEPGRYELSYYVRLPDEIRYRNRGGNNNNRGGGGGRRRRGSTTEYKFFVEYDGGREEAYLDLSNSTDGWTQVGIYDVKSDNMSITLTDECGLRTVMADAVKIVRR